MNDIKIVDNLLPQGYADQIEQDLLRVNFPWYYIQDVTNRAHGNNSGLVHLVCDINAQPSEWYPFIKPVIYSIEEIEGKSIKDILRIRVGFLTKKTSSNDYQYNTPHVDFLRPHRTACYYVNDSDGDTVLFDKFLKDVNVTDPSEEDVYKFVTSNEFNVAQRSSPKKNSLCIFDGSRFHSSTNPQDHERRLVITLNYIV